VRLRIISSVYELVVLQNYFAACLGLPIPAISVDRWTMLFRPAINATPKSTLLGQRPHNSSVRRCLNTISKGLLRRSYLYGTMSFVPPPSSAHGIDLCTGPPVPASSDKMLWKSLETRSDVIIYDLEDSVPPARADKDAARNRLLNFLSVSSRRWQIPLRGR